MTDALSPGAGGGAASVVGRLLLWASRTRQPAPADCGPVAGAARRHLPDTGAGDAQWPGYPVDEYI